MLILEIMPTTRYHMYEQLRIP